MTNKPKAIYVAHHDDPPCEARLYSGKCNECGFSPDMQSLALWPYCPVCDVSLKNMSCPGCGIAYSKPGKATQQR